MVSQVYIGSSGADRFGPSDLSAPLPCPGAMTFGKQTDELEAHRILDTQVGIRARRGACSGSR
jgi:hypothetical protein